MPLDVIFSKIINDVKVNAQTSEGTLVFCRTHKQCSMIYPVFSNVLGNIFKKTRNITKDAPGVVYTKVPPVAY